MDAQTYVAEAKKLVGTKYLHQGRTVNGVDCLGLVVLPAIACGLKVIDCTVYPKLGAGPQLLAALEEQLVRCDGTQIGDILVFDLGSANYHLAIRTGYGILYASYSLTGLVTETVYRKPWTDRYIRAYRFKEF